MFWFWIFARPCADSCAEPVRPVKTVKSSGCGDGSNVNRPVLITPVKTRMGLVYQITDCCASPADSMDGEYLTFPDRRWAEKLTERGPLEAPSTLVNRGYG